MDSEVKIGKTSVVRETQVGTVVNKEERDIVSFYEQTSKIAHMDTGLLPLAGSGVLSIRQALDHTQIVFQHAPGMYYVNWGAYERDANAKTYHLAQPWRVVIGDLKDGNLLGAKTFYSPIPVQTLDQPLYHVNLPNINCRGYGQGRGGVDGNAVGWICLYHTQDWSSYSLGEKIRALVERASGVETYNDANMSETDGPRFYQSAGKPEYMWNPHVWQEKSLKEGFEWILDESLLIPVLVEGIDRQHKHVPNGVPLTLEMAMYGEYSAYYGDNYRPKPINRFSRSDLANPAPEIISQHFTAAFSKSPALGAPTVNTTPVFPNTTAPAGAFDDDPFFGEPEDVVTVTVCDCCEEEIPIDDDFATPDNLGSIKIVCSNCIGECYDFCCSCEELTYADKLQVFLFDDGSKLFYCQDCETVIACKNCGTNYLQKNLHEIGSGYVPYVIEDGAYCSQCDTAQECSVCNGFYASLHILNIDAKSKETGEQTVFDVCQDCVEASTICGCGYIMKSDLTSPPLGESGVNACGSCIDYKDDGLPIYSPAAQTSVG